MRLMALHPPPPSPNTFNTGGFGRAGLRKLGLDGMGIVIGSPLCQLCCNRCAIAADPPDLAASAAEVVQLLFGEGMGVANYSHFTRQGGLIQRKADHRAVFLNERTDDLQMPI